jgi:hypothetical protein
MPLAKDTSRRRLTIDVTSLPFRVSKQWYVKLALYIYVIMKYWDPEGQNNTSCSCEPQSQQPVDVTNSLGWYSIQGFTICKSGTLSCR